MQPQTQANPVQTVTLMLKLVGGRRPHPPAERSALSHLLPRKINLNPAERFCRIQGLDHLPAAIQQHALNATGSSIQGCVF